MALNEGVVLSQKEARLLSPGESAVYASRPRQTTTPSTGRVQGALVLLTSKRLLICKKKAFGSPAVDFEVSWRECSSVSADVTAGDMMSITVALQTQHGSVEVLTDPTDAYELESRMRAAYLSVRT